MRFSAKKLDMLQYLFNLLAQIEEGLHSVPKMSIPVILTLLLLNLETTLHLAVILFAKFLFLIENKYVKGICTF